VFSAPWCGSPFLITFEFRTQRSRIEPTCKLLLAVMHYVATGDTAHNR
jgi:hypothetical protein